MRSISLLFLVAFAALGGSSGGKHNSRAKRDLLVRTKRRWVLSTIEIKEELEVDYPHQISRMFNDKIQGKQFAFHISGEGVDDGLFTVDKDTGAVFAHRPIDREKKSTYHVKFDVFDTETNQRIDRELSFDVEITDINDNAPQFIDPPTTVDVDENWEEGYLPAVFYFKDIDREDSDNSKVTVSIISQDPKEPTIEVLQLDDRMAQLSLKGCFDYDKEKQYKVTLEAKDHGTPVRSSTTVVTLNIGDTNSHPPTFKKREYEAEALEMTVHKDLLRFLVEDKDAMANVDDSKAIYFFISGNEEGLFELETDPKTNEGILSVIKEKNYEKTTLIHLEIGVKNNAPIFMCKNGKQTKDTLPDTAKITMRMIDTNDPPMFEKQTADVFQMEEAQPGQVLFTPRVKDVDSENFRFELAEDPANWMSIDEKTGQITTKKKMDRESPFVGPDNIYKVVIVAIDDGEPPATSTSTINIHLSDINDHVPKLTNNITVMCKNRVNKVTVSAEDLDKNPYSGPFTFSLGDDEKLKQFWELDPSYGEQSNLISLKKLRHGKYSVQLVIKDHQNAIGRETLEVVVCDCEEEDVCDTRNSSSSDVGGAGIGMIIAGLLLFLILLLALQCNFAKKQTEDIESERNESLIQYNQEGGGADCTNIPTVLSSVRHATMTDGITQSNAMLQSQTPLKWSHKMESFNSGQEMYIPPQMTSNNHSYSFHHGGHFHESHERFSNDLAWTKNRRQTHHANSLLSQQSSTRGDLQFRYHKEKLRMLNEEDTPEYKPHSYAYEGRESIYDFLDELSINSLGDNLHFLDDLGPRFKVLGNICTTIIQEKNIQL